MQRAWSHVISMGMALFHPTKIILENFLATPKGWAECASLILPLAFAVYIKATRPNAALNWKFRLALWWFALGVPAVLTVAQYSGWTTSGGMVVHTMNSVQLLLTLGGLVATEFLWHEGLNDPTTGGSDRDNP
jgi:hypothetical protein